MEVPGPSDNGCSAKAIQVDEDREHCLAPISPNPSPTVQVTQHTCLYDNAISQFSLHFNCQTAEKPEDQGALSGFGFISSPSNALRNLVPRELMKKPCQPTEKDLLKVQMLLKEQKAVATQLQNICVAQKREMIRCGRRIAAMEEINNLWFRVAVNTGIQRKLFESINASRAKFISDSKRMESQQELVLATGEENSQKEKIEGLAVEHGDSVPAFVTEHYDTMTGLLKVFSAIGLETTDLKSSLNVLLKKYKEMENTSKECANDGKQIKLGVSSGKQVPRKFNGGGMETLMGASSSSSTDSLPSYEKMSAVSSSDKDDVKMQDAETTEVSMEADPSPPLNPSNAENGGNPYDAE